MNADLDSLRIEREPEAPARAGVSPAWRVLFFVLLLASGAAVWYLAGIRPASDGVSVRVERVAARGGAGPRGEARGGFTASGWVKLPLDYPVRVTPLVEGRVEEISVVEGDRVGAGDPIARLYDTDLRAACEAAEAKVREAEAQAEKLRNGSRPQEIASARAEVHRIEVELATATKILEHSRKLQPSGAIPLEELQVDESKVEVLTAQLAKGHEALGLLEEGFRSEEIDLAEASLERVRAEAELARLQLAYTRIESPIDGVVIERRARVGQWLTPRLDSIVHLYDPEDLEVRVDVNQDDLARVAIGQAVEISSRAQPGVRHPGRVVRVEPLADEVKNTVPVRVKIAEPEGKLLYPDMVVKARFLDEEPVERTEDEGETSPPLITVPVIAVVSDGDDHHVFVVREGRAARIAVRLGELSGGRYAVLEGLRGGEALVVRGVESLADGTAVRVENERTTNQE